MLIEGASFFDIPEDSGSQFISAGTEELEAIRGSSLPRCLGEPLLKEGGLHMPYGPLRSRNLQCN